MGLFDNNVKKQLYIIEEENKALRYQIENLKKLNSDLEIQLKLLEADKQKIEINNRILQSEIIECQGLLNRPNIEKQKMEESFNDLRVNIRQSQKELDGLNGAIELKKSEIGELNEEYIIMDEAVLLQSFGLYTPQYNFANSQLYKECLEDVRNQQKKIVINKKAAICLKTWIVEGSVEKGKQLMDDHIKQVIRTFNTECDNLVNALKFSNYDASKKRILKSFQSLNKLNKLNKIVIQDEYLDLKYQELDLAYEYAQKKQEEKEELRQQRELRKEELRLAKELEEKRLEVEKEQQHYLNAMQKLREQIEVEENQERLVLLREREKEILQGLNDADKALQDLDYRQANQRAGYVYVISNLGAFGENIYKIGMTRRLEPQERIDELSGASVPFRFDVHAMIFSDDAPKLEASLHHAFEAKKLNAVNGRKEFFKVTLEEIEEVIKANHDKSVDFIKFPEAQQYRESIKIRSVNGTIPKFV